MRKRVFDALRAKYDEVNADYVLIDGVVYGVVYGFTRYGTSSVSVRFKDDYISEITTRKNDGNILNDSIVSRFIDAFNDADNELAFGVIELILNLA